MTRKRTVWQLAAALISVITASVPAYVPEQVHIAMLRYGMDNRSGVCFSDSFLRLAAMETSAQVSPEFVHVELASDDLFSYPLVVMTGEGAFELSDEEVLRLRAYVLQGGFLLASAGCSSDAWSVSMHRALDRVFSGSTMTELNLEHEVFHALFDIREFVSRRRASVALLGMELDGRLSVIFSAQGLNDSGSAGVDEQGASCCCCTGDEIVGARFLNANIVIYALTR